MLSTAFILEAVLMRERVPSFKQYPFNLPFLRKFSSLPIHPEMTIFVGDNGSGKSTLLEAIAVAAGMNAEGGGRNVKFETRNTHSDLHDALALFRGTRRPRDTYFLRAESHYALSTYIEELPGPWKHEPYGGKPLHGMSHGESFWAVLRNRFGEDGLYILDEPEAALSPTRQLAALAQMHTLARCGSQFIIATHSPILMAYPGATIYLFGEGIPKPVKYEETEHYLVFRDFFNRREAMMKELLEDY